MADDELAGRIAQKIKDHIISAVSLARQLRDMGYLVEMSVDGWQTLDPGLRVTRELEILNYPK